MTTIAKTEIVWLFLAAGAFGIVDYGGGLPRWRPSPAASFSPVALVASVKGFAWTGSGASLGSMGPFFAKASAFTFGSGLAIVPFLHQGGLVHDRHWLTDQQFVDAVAMGLISPGPVVIMATFAGYIVYGITGALIATVAVFLPVYLFVILPGRYLRRHGEHPRLQGFIQGATAAAAGAIAGAAIVIGEQVIATAASVAIALAALALLLQRRLKIPEPALVAVAAAVALFWLRDEHRLLDTFAIGLLTAAAGFLLRKSANMPQLDDDGLSGFSANDWLAPTVTYVVLGVYGAVRPPSEPRRYSQVRAAATVIALAVNVLTI